MDNNNQSAPTRKIPQVKSVWWRLPRYFVSAVLISYAFYWVLSQMDLDDLRSLNNSRGTLFEAMLSIMPAKAWGWFLFWTIIIPIFWDDWHKFRWQSFPKEVSGVDDISGRGDE